MSRNAPHNVDELFAIQPGLFAWHPPSQTERQRLKAGDDVKLFFQEPGFRFPRARWLIVTGKSGDSYTGVLADRYDEQKRNAFGEIEFDLSHVYRLPLDRPEAEHAGFNLPLRHLTAP